MTTTRISDEIQKQQALLQQYRATNDLKRLLMILGIKSARPSGLIMSFAGLSVGKPSLYAVTKKVSYGD